MNYSHLQYFLKLSETQHYGRAAEDLFITQPSLTHAIKSLEKELGVPLFEKDGRRVKLTKFGKQFAEYTRKGVREIEKGVDLAREYGDGLSGELNIGAIFTVQGDYLPALLKDYKEIYGDGVKFHLFQGFSLSLLDALERGEFDAVFCARDLQREKVSYDMVVSHELVACVAKDHPFAARASIELADLKEFPVYTYRRGTPIGEEVNDILTAASISASQEYEDEISIGGFIQSSGDACGLCTLSIGLKSFGDLVILPIRDVPKDFHRIYLAYNREGFKSRALETFLEFTASYEPPAEAIPSTGYVRG